MKVPEGWRKSTIGANADLVTGHAFKSSQYTDFDEDIRLLRGDNIAQGSLRWRDAKRFPAIEARNFERYALKAGDFVIAMDRTWIPAGLKISEVNPTDLPCLLVQRVARLRAKPTLDQRLLKQLIGTHKFEQYVKSVQTETAVPHISPKDIREYSVLLPSIAEQKKIADILSTWDRAIETVEKLIANSQAQKKALMQQLLTGKKRLPGFNGEWNRACLRDLFIFKKGQGLSKGEVSNNGTFKCILYGELYTRYNDVINEVFYKTNVPEGVPSKRDDILIPASTTTTGIDLANATAVLEDNIFLGGDINILRKKKNNISASFFARYLTHAKKKEIAQKTQGITIIHLYSEQLKPIIVDLPPLVEQKAIAKLLNCLDSEIEKKQKYLSKLKIEKSALMQQLLTGKRRVKIKENNE